MAHCEWQRGAQPTAIIRLGRKRAKPGGYELLVETDQDLDSCTLELAESAALTEATGLAEAIFNHNQQGVLRRAKAGTTARGAQVTYSKVGSAPTAGSDVAVVVVGETPYAEGFGDVGGPEWAFDPEDGGVPREAKSLDLQAVDQAVIDKVCGAIAKCVVLVVPGRPQVIPPAQLSTIDALVASWLPGSQGEGVADVLFGQRPFTGKLSHTWPRSADQEPINIGDRGYDPLYRFGWGLRTTVSR